MILLDTDHLSVLTEPQNSQYGALMPRLQATSAQGLATTVVNAEETLRGWLALINREQDVHQQIFAYQRLVSLLSFLARWDIFPFDVRAADEFKGLRKLRVRIGTMDLKIASIAIVYDALLLSANLRDFRQVPGLKVESWLE